MTRQLLMISTDRSIFDKESVVAQRQIENAKSWEQVHIIIFAEKGKYPSTLQLGNNCYVYSTESTSKLFYPWGAISVGKLIVGNNKITEITCQDSSLTAMAGVALKNKFKIPLEIQIHGDIGSPYFVKSFTNKIRHILAKKYLPKADRIRVVSNRIKDFVQKLLDKSGKNIPIEVRPISINEEEIKNAPVIEGADLRKKYKQFDQIVLMASRLESEKNIDLAIETWSAVVRDFPRAGLLIVGSGSCEDGLKKLVVQNQLQKSVIFESWVEKKALYSYYKTCDIFLVTSLFEGYGLTLMEAKLSGAKIISTDVGIAREVGAEIVLHDHFDLSKKIKAVLSKNNNLGSVE